MRRSILAVSLTSALLVLAAFASATSPRLHLLGDDLGLRIDGRYAVLFGEDRRDIVARDTRTGRSRRYHASCGVSGSVQAFHKGLLLLDCGAGTYALLNVATGTTRTVLGSKAADFFVSVGRYWLAGDTAEDSQTPSVLYLNWHTGERRTRPGSFSAAPPRNLDDPRLGRRRSGSEFGDAPPLYRGSVVVRQKPAPNGALVLQTEKRKILLSRCRAACHWVQFARGLVVWAEGRDVRAYRLKDDKRLSWRGIGGKGDAIVGATSYEVFLNKWLEDPLRNPQAHIRLYRARWRR